jgi:hypothetical protein
MIAPITPMDCEYWRLMSILFDEVYGLFFEPGEDGDDKFFFVVLLVMVFRSLPDSVFA